MKVLVTGGAGYAGSRLVTHLLWLGHEVTVLDKLLFGGEGLLHVADHPKLKIRVGDIVTVRGKYDAIVHLAAIVGDAACRENEKEAWRTNVAGTERLLGHSEKFIFFSTCSNYGVSKGAMATEDSPVNPLSLYAETKVEAEALVLKAKGCVLRLGTLCGVSNRMRFDLLVNEAARCVAQNEPVDIYNPNAWRPFLHIADMCRAVGAMLEFPRAGVWNVVGENVTKGNLGKRILNHYPDAVVNFTGKSNDPRDYRVSGEKLGFTPQFTVKDALFHVVDAVKLLPETGRKIYRNVA